MPNAITKKIPNTVTCLNLFSGCIAIVMAYEAKYELALGFIVLSAIFDFFDGMLARLLNAPSPIGKELDSLADDISFGVAPAMIVFTFLKEPALQYPTFLESIRDYVPYFAFIIAAFSALRLAKFNIDERQTSSFIGVPTPANALFWGSLIAGSGSFLLSNEINVLWVLLLILIFSLLLTAELPMFALKVKNLKWTDNKIQYIFIIGAIPLLVIFKLSGIAAVIAWYIVLSLVTQKK